MARLTGADFIALQVRDLEASTTFYDGHARTASTTAVAAWSRRVRDRSGPVAIRGPLVDPDDSTRGAKIVQELTDGPFGWQFVFVDPDGYPIMAHQPM